MTNAIKSSVSKLDYKVSRLEMAVSEAEKRMIQLRQIKSNPSSQTQDLFSSAPRQAEPDMKILASRLDGAISKVEAMLREGGARRG